MARERVVYHRGNRWVGKRPSCWTPHGISALVVLTRTARVSMSLKPFRGWCVMDIVSRRPPGGGRPDPLLERRERPSVKKVKLSERGAVKHLAPLETEYFSDHMPIVEALGMLQYDDGSPRQAGYLGIWTQGATWFCRMTDKDSSATLTAEGRTLDEALDTLAVLLSSENAPWTPGVKKAPRK